MDGEDQKQVEASTLSARLTEAKAELARSQDRRKEMARVIAARDIKIAKAEAEIAHLRTELQARFEELAAMQRLLLRSSLPGRAKVSITHLGNRVRKFFPGGAREP
jgi:septal ring factor EnvC (AmiA/AmiB activator)